MILSRNFRYCFASLALLLVEVAWACPTCGNKGFTKEMLLMTMGFALLPLSIMFAIAWRILREEEVGQERFKNRHLGLGKKETP